MSYFHPIWGKPVVNVKMCWGNPCLDQTSDAAPPKQPQMQSKIQSKAKKELATLTPNEIADYAEELSKYDKVAVLRELKYLTDGTYKMNDGNRKLMMKAVKFEIKRRKYH